MKLHVLHSRFAICRLPASTSVPPWAWRSEFSSVTRSADELSIVCSESHIPVEFPAERGWMCFKVRGPLDLSMTGVLYSLAQPLSDAGIAIFAVSTHDTDYLLVKAEKLESAKQALIAAGHEILPG